MELLLVWRAVCRQGQGEGSRHAASPAGGVTHRRHRQCWLGAILGRAQAGMARGRARRGASGGCGGGSLGFPRNPAGLPSSDAQRPAYREESR